MFVIAILVNVSMWLERFVIIVTSLHRDYLQMSWGNYAPTFWDYATFLGTIGLFLCLFLMFVRVLPANSMSETRERVRRTDGARRRAIDLMEPSHVR